MVKMTKIKQGNKLDNNITYKQLVNLKIKMYLV